MVGDYMGTLGDECFLPPHPFALDGGEGVGLRDTLHEKREKGFSFFSTEYPRGHEACVTGYSAPRRERELCEGHGSIYKQGLRRRVRLLIQACGALNYIILRICFKVTES